MDTPTTPTVEQLLERIARLEENIRPSNNYYRAGDKVGLWTLVRRHEDGQRWVATCACGNESAIHPSRVLRSKLQLRCVDCANKMRVKPYKCQHCGLTDPNKFGKRKTACEACDQRKVRNGVCTKCNAGMRSTRGVKWCERCDGSPKGKVKPEREPATIKVVIPPGPLTGPVPEIPSRIRDRERFVRVTHDQLAKVDALAQSMRKSRSEIVRRLLDLAFERVAPGRLQSVDHAAGVVRDEAGPASAPRTRSG